MTTRTVKPTLSLTATQVKSVTKITAMSREQFAKTRIGSDLLRGSPKKYSLAQMFVLSALGGAVGAGVGKLLNKSVPISAGVGAAAGGSGSLVAQSLKKPDYNVSGGIEVGNTTAVLLSPTTKQQSKSRSVSRSVTDGAVRPILVSGSLSPDPIGWLGGLAAHGNLVQALMIRYVHDRDRDEVHIHPGLRFKDPDNKHGAGQPWPNDIGVATVNDYYKHQRHTGSSKLFANRFCEWPSPVFQGWFTTIEMNSTFMPQPDYANSRWNSRPGTMVRDFVLGMDGYRSKEVWKTNKGKNKNFENYIAAVNRFQTKQGAPQSAGAIATAFTAQRVKPFSERKHIPGVILWDTEVSYPYWVKTPSQREAFGKRNWNYFEACRWYVWAGEMLRLHSPGTRFLSPSQEWVDHCLLWGIGVPTTYQAISRKNMVEWYKKQGVDTGMSRNQVDAILKALMRNTPPPGHPDYNGAHIAVAGRGRLMMDIPETAGTINPPVWTEWDSWWQERLYKWGTRPKMKRQAAILSIALAAYKAIAGVVSCGSVSTALEVVSCISDIVQLGYKWLVERDIDLEDFGDIVGIAGKATTSLNIDLEFDGNITAGTQQLLDQFNNGVTALQTIYQWDYTNEAFGGMFSDQDLAAFLEAQGIV